MCHQTRESVVLVDTAMPEGYPEAIPDEKTAIFTGRWIKDYVEALKDLGYEPEQVTKILITHKHNDHSGQIGRFPNAKVYINRIETVTDELKNIDNIVPVDFVSGPYYNFKRSEIIVEGIRMIPAPGQTYGNSIIIAENEGLFYMFHDDIHLARSTQNQIIEFIKNNPTVYLSTHSPQGRENLEAKRVMDLDNPPATIYPEEDFTFDEGTGKYICSICGYIYNPEEGDPKNGIPAGTPFDELPDDWHCPRCRQGKDKFNKA